MRCGCVTVLGFVALSGLSAGQAVAGPWVRGAGDIFVSLQISAEEAQSDIMAGLWEPETYLSGYGEIGLGRGLTLGADIGRGDISRQAIGFLRYTLTDPDATWQMAVDAGGGLRQFGDADPEGLLRLGASIGRGFGGGGDAWYMPMRHQGGWTNLDLTALYNLQREQTIWQAEATVGFSLSDTASAIFQIKAEDWPGADPLLSVAPSIVMQVGPTTSLSFGARAAVAGSDAMGLTLSLWQEF